MIRIAVTGLGPVTPIGIGSGFETAWRASASGIGPITRFNAAGHPVRIAGEVDLDPQSWLSTREVRAMDRVAVLAVVAGDIALHQSGLLSDTDPEQVGVFVGSGAGGADSWLAAGHAVSRGDGGRVGPRLVPNGMVNSAGAEIGIRHGLRGPVMSSASACSSGSDALVSAVQALRCGEVVAAVAGGADAPVNPIIVGGFSALHALSRRNHDPQGASRPFAADRDGFVLAEGAGVLVLEEWNHAHARGAPILAELAGYGRSSDASHITRPSEAGEGAQRAMMRALTQTGTAPSEVDHIAAHGTATALNDASETRAIQTVLGSAAASTPVSSIKGLIGHTLGAAGSLSAIAAVQSLLSGVVPGTANLHHPDPELPLDFVAEGARHVAPSTVMVNTNAFGGQNVSLLFRRTREQEECR